MAVTPELFIEGMRQLAAGVTVITTAHGARRAGLTATAVCSLSAEPPRLVACINRRVDAHDAICAAGIFAVNLLASNQRRLAEAFSGTAGVFGERRFDQARWTTLVTGAPVLASCLVSFDCRIVETVAASTHTMFIGEVEAVTVEAEREPLVYVEGDYGLIAPLLAPASGTGSDPAW